MAITINHGNIAAALGLAAAAGTAQRDKTIGDQDLSFLGLMQNAQGEADRNYASQIGLALQGNQNQASNALAANQQGIEQQHFAAQRATADRQFGFEQQQLASLNANRGLQNDARQQGLSIRQDQQDTRQQGQDLRQQQYTDTTNARAQLGDGVGTYLTASGGRMYIPGNLGVDQEAREMQAQAALTLRETQAAQKQLQAASYSSDPKDALGPRAKQSAAVPGAAAGMESQYQQAAQTIAAMQARQKMLDDALNRKTVDAMANPGAVQSRNLANYVGQLTGHGSTPANPGSNPAVSDTSGNSSGGVPVVSSAAEYMALPPGARYIWGPDGKRYVKQ